MNTCIYDAFGGGGGVCVSDHLNYPTLNTVFNTCICTKYTYYKTKTNRMIFNSSKNLIDTII